MTETESRTGRVETSLQSLRCDPRHQMGVMERGEGNSSERKLVNIGLHGLFSSWSLNAIVFAVLFFAGCSHVFKYTSFPEVPRVV